jgi:phage baseplate assembly protein gpV
VSTGLLEAVARVARHEVGALAMAAVGTVTELHPDTDHAVTVELRDSRLVLAKVPVAVGLLGFAAIPAVGHLVLVLFLEGDRNAPVVVGRLYHPELDPPAHADGEVVLRLPAGSDEPTVDLVVAAQTPKVTLDLPGEVHIEIADGSVHIDVGELHARLESAGGGRVEVAAGGSTLILKKDGDVSLTAAGNLTIEGTEVKIRASGTVAVQGATVELN